MGGESTEWTTFQRPRGAVRMRSSALAIEARWSGHFDLADDEARRPEMERRCRGASGWRWCLDLTAVEGFTADVRNTWGDWFRSNWKLFERAVFLHNSALLRIALTMVNIALGGMLDGHAPAAAANAGRSR